MIAVEVAVTGDLEQAFARFGNGHAYKLADKTIRLVGYRYRSYLKKEYLSGQMLGKRSGQLTDSMVVGRPKGYGSRLVYLVGGKKKVRKDGSNTAAAIKLANIYEHAGGYVIEPKNARTLVFTAPDGSTVFTKRSQGRERPFMTASAKAFDWKGAFAKSEEDVIGKELKRLAKEGIYVPGGLD